MNKRFKFFYICVEALLLCGFTYADFSGRYELSAFLKFSSIFVNTLTLSIMLIVRQIKKDKLKEHPGRFIFIVIALFITLAADVFLILLDTHYLLGVFLFCIVECCYAIFLIADKKLFSDIAVRLGIFAVLCIILKMLDFFDPLTAASVFSMTQLSLNVFFAWKRQRFAGRSFALGLTLFWFCDAFVGLLNIGDYIAVPAWLPDLAGRVIWWFYLPAQMLILLSFEKCGLYRTDNTRR